jgi:hypothetical protein
MDEWRSPKVKTNLVPTAIGSWGIAVSGAAAYDLTSQQTVAMFATVPATLRLSNVLRINLNAGWDWDRVAGSTMRLTARAWTGERRTMSGLSPPKSSAGSARGRCHWRDRAALPGRAALASDRRLQHGSDLRPQYLWRKCELDHTRDHGSLSRRAVTPRHSETVHHDCDGEGDDAGPVHNRWYADQQGRPAEAAGP